MSPTLQGGFVIFLLGVSFLFSYAGLCLLLACLVFGERKAAGIHWTVFGVPLYVTEAVLLGVALRLVFDLLRSTRDRSQGSPDKGRRPLWKVFYGNAAFSMLRGFLAYRPLDVLRDSALIYYSAFSHIAARLVPSVERLKTLALVLGGALLFKILLQTLGQGMGGGADSLYAACFLGASLFTMPLWEKRRRWFFAVLALLFCEVVVWRVRTSWVSLAAFFLFYTISLLYFKMDKRLLLKAVITLAAGIALAFVFPEGVFRALYKMGGGESSPHLITREFQSLFEGFQSPNLLTRFYLWVDVLEDVFSAKINYFRSQWRDPHDMTHDERERLEAQVGAFRFKWEVSAPLSRSLVNAKPLRMLNGAPFGERFIPPRVYWWMWETHRYDPHNSHLAVLYRTGVVGFLSYLLLLWICFREGLGVVSRAGNLETRCLFLALLGCLVIHFFHSMADVTLENPQKGVFLWVILGLTRALRRLEPPGSREAQGPC